MREQVRSVGMILCLTILVALLIMAPASAGVERQPFTARDDNDVLHMAWGETETVESSSGAVDLRLLHYANNLGEKTDKNMGIGNDKNVNKFYIFSDRDVYDYAVVTTGELYNSEGDVILSGDITIIVWSELYPNDVYPLHYFVMWSPDYFKNEVYAGEITEDWYEFTPEDMQPHLEVILEYIPGEVLMGLPKIPSPIDDGDNGGGGGAVIVIGKGP